MRRRQQVALENERLAASKLFQQPAKEIANETHENASVKRKEGRRKAEVLKVCPHCRGAFKALGVHLRFCKKA